MPHSRAYKKFIESEEMVIKSIPHLIPMNIYRILTYKYADGDMKALTGTKISYIFLIGISVDKKLHCLKISEILPQKFFQWLNLIIRNEVTPEMLMESERLDEILVKSDRRGKVTFNRYVKPKQIYRLEPRVYRTYNYSGIIRINRVNLKKDVLSRFI